MKHGGDPSELREKLAVDDALVVLTVAAAMTYFYVTDPARQVEKSESLPSILPLVAIALSTVAPICRADGTPLSVQELDELLFRRTAGVGASAGTLAQLRIRRGDLDTAMALLRETRIAFGDHR